MTDERAQKLARKIKNSFDPDYGSEVDDMLVHAIKLTTQLAAEFCDAVKPDPRMSDNPVFTEGVARGLEIAKAQLEQFYHLPADGDEK